MIITINTIIINNPSVSLWYQTNQNTNIIDLRPRENGNDYCISLYIIPIPLFALISKPRSNDPEYKYYQLRSIKDIGNDYCVSLYIIPNFLFCVF